MCDEWSVGQPVEQDLTWPGLPAELEGVNYYFFQIQRTKEVCNKSPTHACLCLNTLVSSQNQYKHSLVQTKVK